LLLSCAATAAWAGTDSCTVDTRNVQFGIYDPTFPQPDNTTGDVSLRCDCQGNGCGAIHYNITISGGGPDGTGRSMQPQGGGGQLRYDLYSDPNRSQLWAGAGQSVSGVIPPPTFGQLMLIPIYASVRPLQSVRAGDYLDTVQVVIMF